MRLPLGIRSWGANDVTRDVRVDVDGDYLVATTAALCGIPSPTGYTDGAVRFVVERFKALGLDARRTVKGAVVVSLSGGREGSKGDRTLSAHVDTLGAMVKDIKPNGRLKLTRIGGYDWATIEGEYCMVHTAAAVGSREAVTGTVLTVKASSHVHGRALAAQKRDEDSMEVRLDARATTAGAVRELGVEVGDFVSFDARTVVTDDGFVKSRHLDDKAGVAILLGVAKAVVARKVELAVPAHLFISTFEEVGHGSSAGLPAKTRELIAVDMAAVGTGQTSDEFSASVCVKDASGPYDRPLSRQLIDLARAGDIACRIDVYPDYASDVSQALRAGWDVRGALVGPGVDASHSFERTHREALEATARLLLAYVTSPMLANEGILG